MSDYEAKRRELLSWPGTSHWLAKAIDDLGRRDPVNAAHDAAQLLELAQIRMNEALRMPPVRKPQAPPFFRGEGAPGAGD